MGGKRFEADEAVIVCTRLRCGGRMQLYTYHREYRRMIVRSIRESASIHHSKSSRVPFLPFLCIVFLSLLLLEADIHNDRASVETLHQSPWRGVRLAGLSPSRHSHLVSSLPSSSRQKVRPRLIYLFLKFLLVSSNPSSVTSCPYATRSTSSNSLIIGGLTNGRTDDTTMPAIPVAGSIQ